MVIRMNAANYSRSSFSATDTYKMDSGGTIDRKTSSRRGEALQCYPPAVEPEYHSTSSWMDVDSDMPPVSKRMRSFRIDDEKAVVKYLKERLLLLQQQAAKRIAKAWIKGICPKKQARHPYRSKKEPSPDHGIPSWWPINECPFVEPDHVEKDARMALCLHLLRLRPSEEQLKEWNEELHAPNKTRACSWTAFLRELTPASTLDGLGKSAEPEEKSKQRQKIMQDMYDIAEKEESYKRGECDGDDMYCWEEYDDTLAILSKKAQPKKRAREDQESKGSDSGGRRQKKSKSAATEEGRQGKAALAEKIRKIDLTETALHESPSPASDVTYCDQMGPVLATNQHCKDYNCCSSRSIQRRQTERMPVSNQTRFHSDAFPQWSSVGHSTSQQNSPMTTSFCSSHSSSDGMYDSYQTREAPTTFPGRRDYTFEEPLNRQRNRMIYAYTLQHMPVPQFDAVPNTTMVSPTKFEQFPENAAWPQQYHDGQAMERYQSQVSVPYDQGFGAPTAVSQPMMMPANTQYAQTPFAQQDNMRSASPAAETVPSYKRYQTIDYGHPHVHGLPTTYHHAYPTPEENGQNIPFAYPEPMPDANFPAAPLPASVVRGFTGTSSGVSGGAWT